MRFARDLASLAGVVDEAAYYAGAIYPDSRYLTGVSREQTHRIDVPTFPFTNDQTDFQKGWATHLLYDDLAGARLKSFFCVEEIGDFDQRWMKTIAVLASEVQALQKDAEATKRIQFLYNEVLSEIL